MLYPKQNQYRSVTDITGFWSFKADPLQLGDKEKWYEHWDKEDELTIAVPGAWNEQLAEQGLKNFVGKGWYKTEFSIPKILSENQRIALRVGAADHTARAWLNGVFVGEHQGGYMPFEIELNAALTTDGSLNNLVICVDSTITMHTIPQHVDPTEAPYDGPSYVRRHLYPATRFDFFPYGGLTRSVQIVTTAPSYLSSIQIRSDLSGSVKVQVNGKLEDCTIKARVLDAEDKACSEWFEISAGHGKTEVTDAKTWSPSSPYLHTLEVSVVKNGTEIDAYKEEFGFREIKTDGGILLLNGEPVFLAGFGKHEDYPIVGRGQFKAGYLRDFELMRWIGANSFRTSHYPYDEEMMRLADRLGFLIINEVPAVSLGFYSSDFDELKPLLDNHKKSIEELVARDFNHPSVISWCITNEPNHWAEEHYQNEASERYFKTLYDLTHDLDGSRPVMAITMAIHSENDIAFKHADILGLNRYFGWYTKPVDLEQAMVDLGDELDRIHKKYNRPVMITEFGADTVSGYHSTTAQLFTEEFQTAFTMSYNKVMEERDFCVGAHIWNFADFYTPQHFRRVVMNQKGVFTRERNPKSVAFTVRDYWKSLNRILPQHRPKPGSTEFLVPDIQKS